MAHGDPRGCEPRRAHGESRWENPRGDMVNPKDTNTREHIVTLKDLLEKKKGKRKESSPNRLPLIPKKQRSGVQARNETSGARLLGSQSKSSSGQAFDQARPPPGFPITKLDTTEAPVPQSTSTFVNIDNRPSEVERLRNNSLHKVESTKLVTKDTFRRRSQIAEVLVEKNFDLAFQVIYEFNLPVVDIYASVAASLAERKGGSQLTKFFRNIKGTVDDDDWDQVLGAAINVYANKHKERPDHLIDMLTSSHGKALACVVCGRLKNAFQIASRSGSVADVQYVAH
ncbi:hypothetical protein KIW84_045989 [Lathyrus oleraceus]|uniref:ZFYVE26-like TPR repeats domain-containing protein n=1 Tax=Pisum sativum TaxID=3888 RepID=A0A9D5AXZ9_PEA|nr:hypothetical protein KIW84_045989 [Pisum sativum]